MKQKKKNTKVVQSGTFIEPVWKLWRLSPVMLVIAFVPLISSAKTYDAGMSKFPWFSSNDQWVDIFLYWKGQMLILLALIMVAMLTISVIDAAWYPVWKRIKTPEMLWIFLYLLLATGSAVFSEYRSFALLGSYEQWEGLNVILAYVTVFFYVCLVVDSDRQIRYLCYAVIIGSFIMGLIGTFQYLGMDLFRSDLGQAIMNLMSSRKMKFSFNFSEGWVYATLYNPNYVGSYAALVLPVLLAVALIEWKKIPIFWTILSIAGTCLMTVTLIGSQSLTGCIGVIASLIFVAVIRFPNLLEAWGIKKILLGAAGVGVLITVMCFMFPEQIQFGVNKLIRPTKDYHMIKKMESTSKGLAVTTVDGDTIYVQVTGEISAPVTARDEQQTELELIKDSEKNYYTPDDQRFSMIRFSPKTISVGEEADTYEAVEVSNPEINKAWTIAKVDDTYMVYNALGKLDDLREIPSFGFEKNQHFGDKRGYIWSRTIPLFKRYLFLGSGPNTFTEVFPNDDYVGKTNMNYDGVPVTKPHNMYFQTWVQTGMLSLVAYLFLMGWYWIKSLLLYWKRPLRTFTEKVGFAIYISVTGYLITGIANDSTVTVAPVFWSLLALGIVINLRIKYQEKTAEKNS